MQSVKKMPSIIFLICLLSLKYVISFQLKNSRFIKSSNLIKNNFLSDKSEEAFVKDFIVKSFKKHSITKLYQYKNFDDMMEKIDMPVLVDFYAQWCGPCVMMQPILEDVAKRLENEIRVAKVDTERSPKLGSRYQVEALPTLILFNKGEVVEKFIGYRTADELEYEVRRALNTINSAPA